MYILGQINPSLAVCFSGHRPDRLPGRGEPDAPEISFLTDALQKHIEGAVKRGKDTFISGIMAGWDVLAAEQVIALKEQYTHIRLVTIAPYKKQFFTHEPCWTDGWVKRARDICNLHDVGAKIAECYRAGIYYERNRALVDNSSELICYWDGGRGGTQYTVLYARNKGLTVHNLFPAQKVKQR